MQSQPEHFINLPLVSETEENICLPLVFNVVAKYWGEDIPINEAASIAAKYPNARGTIMMEGIDLAKKHGLETFTYRGSVMDLKKRVDQGIPPIVILPGIMDTVQHASIVSGYNPEERRILTYIPDPEKIGAIPQGKFQQDWQQDDFVTIVLVPKEMSSLLENENLEFRESNKICFEAERLHQQGKIAEAISQLTEAVKIDDRNSQAWCLLAGLYNELNSDKAISCYSSALEHNPNYYLAFRGLGNYYLKRKDYSQAQAYYTKAINLNPSRFTPIYKNRAITKMNLNDNLGAKQDLQTYIEQNPNASDRDSIRTAISEL